MIALVATKAAARRGGRSLYVSCPNFGESGGCDDNCDDNCDDDCDDDDCDDDNTDGVDGNDPIVQGVEPSIVTPLLTVCKGGCVSKRHEHV